MIHTEVRGAKGSYKAVYYVDTGHCMLGMQMVLWRVQICSFAACALSVLCLRVAMGGCSPVSGPACIQITLSVRRSTLMNACSCGLVAAYCVLRLFFSRRPALWRICTHSMHHTCQHVQGSNVQHVPCWHDGVSTRIETEHAGMREVPSAVLAHCSHHQDWLLAVPGLPGMGAGCVHTWQLGCAHAAAWNSMQTHTSKGTWSALANTKARYALKSGY